MMERKYDRRRIVSNNREAWWNWEYFRWGILEKSSWNSKMQTRYCVFCRKILSMHKSWQRIAYHKAIWHTERILEVLSWQQQSHMRLREIARKIYNILHLCALGSMLQFWEKDNDSCKQSSNRSWIAWKNWNWIWVSSTLDKTCMPCIQ